MFKKFGPYLALLIVLVTVARFVTPRVIKGYVEGHYQVKVAQVELGWPVVFHGVEVQREALHAELQEVRATPWGSAPVEILGGTAHVIKKGHARPQASPGGRSIIARGLRVMVEGEGFQADLEGFNLDSSYRFQSGTFTADGRVVHLGAGGISKDLQSVSLDSAEVDLALPFALPKFPSKGVLRVENVKANRGARSAEIGKLSYGPVKAEHVRVEKGQGFSGVAQSVTINHPWVDVGPVTVRDMGFTLDATGASILLDNTVILVDPANYRIAGTGTCGEWVKALPDERPEALQVPPENWSGDINFDVTAKGHGEIAFNFDCKYKCSEEPLKSLRAGLVKYMAYGTHGLFERKLGRGSPDWADIAEIPPLVTKAFITLEDPGFLSHRGIIVQALRNSLTDNLKLGEFFRGGSTITQQLAKNLWLRRHKTLSRKVYEALLAMALESCLTKQEILELYLNVVEFGPDLYGIAPAAKHYFNKNVGDLLPEEAFFLAHTLPHPSKVVPPEQGGLENARKLMRQLVLAGNIEDVYLPAEETSSEGWQTNE